MLRPFGTAVRADCFEIMNVENNDIKKTAIMYGIICAADCIIAAVVFLLAALVCRSQLHVYAKFIFIPFFAFFAGFFNRYFFRKCKSSALVVLPICFLLHLIFARTSWSVFLWMLLYAGNWLIGVILAFLVLSYTARKKTK